jgi:hypothetical protein
LGFHLRFDSGRELWLGGAVTPNRFAIPSRADSTCRTWYPPIVAKHRRYCDGRRRLRLRGTAWESFR